LLIGVARNHASYEVRKQAMFWLGQSGDPRALAFTSCLHVDLRTDRVPRSDRAAGAIERVVVGSE
jgi:hypothetical protein